MRIDLITGAIPAALPRGTAGAPFREGDILKARVAQLMGEGRLLLELENGKTLKAVVVPEMDLAAGERLVLRVCGQALGKTNMQVLLRDGGAETAAVRWAPHAAQDTGAAISPSVQPADAVAIEALCRLVAEAPKIGEALNTAVAKLQTAEAGETTPAAIIPGRESWPPGQAQRRRPPRRGQSDAAAGTLNRRAAATPRPPIHSVVHAGGARAAQAAPGAGQPDAAAGTPVQQAPAVPPLSIPAREPVPGSAGGAGRPGRGTARRGGRYARATGARHGHTASRRFTARESGDAGAGAGGEGVGNRRRGIRRQGGGRCAEGRIVRIYRRPYPGGPGRGAHAGNRTCRSPRRAGFRRRKPETTGRGPVRTPRRVGPSRVRRAQGRGRESCRAGQAGFQVQQFTYLQIPVMLREK